jgi:hypothetical protein
MVSFPWKFLVETLPHGFLTPNTKKRFWQPKGIPEEEEGVRNEEEGRGGLFIKKIHHQLLDRAADVRQP